MGQPSKKPSVLAEGSSSSDDDDDDDKENVQKKLSFSSSIDSSKNDDSSVRVGDVSSADPSFTKKFGGKKYFSDLSQNNILDGLESSLKDLGIAPKSAPKDVARVVLSSSADDEEVNAVKTNVKSFF